MVKWVEACEHTNGAVGLWNSIRKIVQEAKLQEYELILICEDDHFSPNTILLSICSPISFTQGNKVLYY